MSNFKFFDNGSSATTKIITKPDLKDSKPVNTSLKSARYRSEQQIITKHNGTIASHGIINHEYLLDINKQDDGYDAKVTITDASGSYEPEIMTDMIQLGLLIDSVRHEQKFKGGADGKLKHLTNKQEMISNWMTLKTMQLKDGQMLKHFNNDEQKQILTEVNSYCDVVFSDKYPMLDELYKNLFHFTVFDRYLSTQNIEGKDNNTHHFYSSLFNIPLTMEFVYENVEQKYDTYQFEKNSKLLYVDYNTIIGIYKEQYQPVLKYSFTDYDYTINSKVEVDKSTNFIKQAYVTIKEAVKNNVENTIIYNLKQVEL